MRLALYETGAVGDPPGALVLRAEARAESATPRGDLFVLFDAPLANSKSAYAFEVEADGPLRLRAAAPDSPAFRPLFRY